MGVGTQTLCMRGAVNDRSGRKNFNQSDGWIHSHIIFGRAALRISGCSQRMIKYERRRTLMARKNCQGVRTSEIRFLCVDKNEHETAIFGPPPIITTTEERLGLIPPR